MSKDTNLRGQCFLTCVGPKIKSVTDEHVPKKLLYKNYDILKRSKWFEEHSQEPNVKVLARLIGDMKCRIEVRQTQVFSCDTNDYIFRDSED